jgi:hypothetical protein
MTNKTSTCIIIITISTTQRIYNFICLIKTITIKRKKISGARGLAPLILTEGTM